MKETLRQKQSRFAHMIAKLILWAYDNGYEITLGDAYRDPRVFGAVGERKGYGESKSCHKVRLALDLNLFKNGKYISTTRGHKELAEKWESMGGTAGYRFNDGNHYSLEYNGMK